MMLKVGSAEHMTNFDDVTCDKITTIVKYRQEPTGSSLSSEQVVQIFFAETGSLLRATIFIAKSR